MADSADDRLAKATAWLREQRASKKKGRMATAGEAVDRFLARAGLAKRVAQASVIEEWPELVGLQIAAVTRAESVSPDGVLRVLVSTAAWANELSLMTPRIMARVNAGRKGRIREIRWIPSGDDRRLKPRPDAAPDRRTNGR
jgi:predicted nucleic acid-binding Zn ribbon protein